jgi:hypothetical protein
MRTFHNFSINKKVKKNVKGPSCRIIANKLFVTFQHNQMNYLNLPNQNNLSMI